MSFTHMLNNPVYAEFPKMLYKHGGPHELHRSNFHTHIVKDHVEQAEALNDGWHLTTPEAIAAKKAELQAELDANKVQLKKKPLKSDGWTD